MSRPSDPDPGPVDSGPADSGRADSGPTDSGRAGGGALAGGGAPAGPVRTVCPYCGVGCGVLATPDGRGGAAIAGDPAHPANAGRLCVKGSALGETLGDDGRLLRPRVDGRDVAWDEAIAHVADRFAATIDAHGPDSVAFYVSGQLLSEDYYVANKLMKGFIGSANIDTNSRLCMASSVAGHRRAFGADVVPGLYEDLEQADVVALVGSNLAWCHPVLYQRLAAARAARPDMRIVVIDPRRTATSDLADLELRLNAGSDVALFNGLLNAIIAAGAVDEAFIAAHVADFDAAAAAARAATPASVARATGLSEAALSQFNALWIGAEKVVTVYSQGVNQSTAGTAKVNAIINCHLAAGRIGRPGMGPFSVTGQPNAMGGREVGGLANTLACHLDIENADHRAAVQAFWRAPTMARRPGLKAVDLFDAVAAGRIKALWIMATNPAVSLPEANRVRDAILACPFVVVSDIVADTDTTALADVLLPAAGWGEKSGVVTNSERRISRQRAFLPAPGDARPDWRIIADVAAAMGWGDAFAYDGPAAIFREYAALSGVAARFGRPFDISAHAALDDDAYDALTPFQWPAAADAGANADPNADANAKANADADAPTRFYARGGFHTPDGRARMIGAAWRAPAPGPRNYPLRLNTGRVRDHWHTMTRTARSPRLSRHMAEPYAEIHPDDAARAGVAPASLVTVESPHGAIVARALVSARTAPGAVFVPIHWTSQWTAQGRVGALVPAAVDPISGQPDLKGGRCRIRPFAARWHGFAVSVETPEPTTSYWARARLPGGWAVEMADRAAPTTPAGWEALARAILRPPEGAREIQVIDVCRGAARLAALHNGRLVGAFFAAPEPVAAARAHVVAALGAKIDTTTLLADILAGRPGGDRPDPGAIVCACFNVGANEIRAAIAAQGLADVDAVGRALQAGTNCGSCRPELRALLARAAADADAGEEKEKAA